MRSKVLKNTRNENGQAALLMVLIIMFLLSFICLFLTEMVLKQVKIVKNVEQFTQAYFLADTGTERILYDLKTGKKKLSDYSSGDDFYGGNVNVANGHYNVILKASSPLEIKIVGTYKNTARAIEISW
jgi:hypothetical protein